MNLQIREAGAQDLSWLVESNCRMALETENLTLDPPTVSMGVRAVLEDSGKGRYFVARVDGRFAAQLMLTSEWSDWRNGPIWWIQSVYVLPEFRRSGVFTALYRHVERLAKAGGVPALRLYVERENVIAQQTYQRLGMHLSHYHLMEQKLSGPPRGD